MSYVELKCCAKVKIDITFIRQYKIWSYRYRGKLKGPLWVCLQCLDCFELYKTIYVVTYILHIFERKGLWIRRVGEK